MPTLTENPVAAALALALLGLILAVTLALSIAAAVRRARALAVGAASGLLVTLIVASLWSLPASPVIQVTLVLTLSVIGVLGGSGAARLALGWAGEGPETEGMHGGLLVPESESESDTNDGEPALSPGVAHPTRTREVLRGGTTIGVLERIALIGAILTGYPEAIAALVAIKGIGRFGELDTPATRERFLIGTLASLIWAAAAAAAAVLLV